MSLYREARPRRRQLWLAAGGVAVAVAAVATVLLARSGEPSPAQRLESLPEDVQPALAALELVPLNYRSPDATTRSAAAEQLEVARETVTSLEADLRARDPVATTRVLAALAELERLMAAPGRVAAVERAARQATADLRRLARLD